MLVWCLYVASCVGCLALACAAYIAFPFVVLRRPRRLWSYLRRGSVPDFVWDGRRPLNFLFMTWGSRGDLQPNIALGLELARRGHQVTVMSPKEYRAMVERHKELRWELFEDPHLARLASDFRDFKDFMGSTRDYIQKACESQVQQYMRAGREADVLFGNHAAMLMVQHITAAEALKKPLFLTTHDITLPTAEYSFNIAENRTRNYGRFTNILNHRIFSLMLGAFTHRPYKKLRRGLGLQTSWPFMEVMHPLHLAEFPVFSTADCSLWKPPTDHPPHWMSTGFFVTDQEEVDIHLEVQQWIDKRARSFVYFGQGSFDIHERTTLTDIIIDALTLLDMDGVALTKTVDDRDFGEISFLKVAAEVNQDLLFPQSQVVVHHGGAGTASQCIRSGRPGVCVPAMPFQEVWGARLEEYGAGVLLTHQKMLEAWRRDRTNLLAVALKKAMEPRVRQMAQSLGSQAKGCSGVKMAADKVFELLQQETAEIQPGVIV